MAEKNSIKTTLINAASILNNNEAKLETRLLLTRVLNVNHAWLIAHADDDLTAKAQNKFKALIQRRIAGEPIAYILGEREFYGLTLKVSPDTLIPRADTETLVEAALGKIPTSSFPSNRRPIVGANHIPSKLDSRLLGNNNSKILDLGTGTGAIALAIAQNRSNAQVLGSDTSQAALKIAQQNAYHLKITNVDFILSDWFVALKNQRFDMIVSNPPYIEKNNAHLYQGDLRFEPQSALASGNDGLDDIRQIINGSPNHLKAKGWLMIEHGYQQAKAVTGLLNDAGFIEIEMIQDLTGNDRVTMAKFI